MGTDCNMQMWTLPFVTLFKQLVGDLNAEITPHDVPSMSRFQHRMSFDTLN